MERNNRYGELAARIETCLKNGLVSERHLPRLVDRDPKDGSPPVVYILGGKQDSIGEKIKVAGRLFREGKVNKVFVLHRPGITEYNPALGRNFTNDEWTTAKLKEEGVPAEHLEFIPVPPGPFDTFAEARVISGLVRSRRVKHLALVSSSHHTKRIWLSFSHFDAGNSFDIYTYGSEEKADINELLLEHLKLLLYRYIVLPLDRLSGHFRE